MKQNIEQSRIRQPATLEGAGPKTPQASARAPKSLELHIDELVLHGFAPGDRYRIGVAVERELSRLFLELGFPQLFSRGGEVAHLDAGELEVAAGSKPEAIAARIAQALYGGLMR